jgi:hypothetical protein
MKTQRTIYALIIGLFVTSAVAQVPQLLNYQGRVVVGTTNFDGNGLFKFALVNSNGTVTFWSNDGTSAGGSTPTASVTLPVVRGLYSVQLGDTAIAGMPTALPTTVFTNFDVRLRVWFNDGVTGVQQFTPDQRISAVGYALMGANVPDGAITSNKLANGAVTAAKIADGSITSAKLALNTISSSNIADAITLGETNVNGRLDVYRTSVGTPAISLIGNGSQISTYGSDGQEQIRLYGAGWGELLLNNSLSNNATAVRLTAQGSTGGQLELRNTNGSNRAVLEGENTGGQLTLYQADGGVGAVLYGNEGAGAGALSLRNTNGNARIRLFGQSPDSGGGEITVHDDNGSEVLELKGNSNGGQLTIKDDTGVRNTAFLGSSVGGYQYLYNGLGNISVYLDGDSGGGGYASLRNTNGSSRVILDGFSTGGGGGISLYDSDGTETIEMLGAEGTGAGGQLLMRNAAGTSTIQLDSDASGVRCGYLALYTSNGVATIILDAAGSGDGRITTQVLQITGGSDLSEQFDIKALHDEIKPGMIVSIDADHAGQLVTSSKAYDKTVAGIVSGAGGVQTGMLMGQRGTAADGKHPVALTGRVYCWVDADQGAIRPGDLITTSDTPGHGMKVTEHGRAQGAIIGKAMSSLDKGRGLVLVLVSLQ